MPKQYHFSKREIDDAITIYRLGYGRKDISRVMKWRHDKSQYLLVHYAVASDRQQHKNMMNENLAKDRARAKSTGIPRSNFRKQREIQLLGDYIGSNTDRFTELIKRVSP